MISDEQGRKWLSIDEKCWGGGELGQQNIWLNLQPRQGWRGVALIGILLNCPVFILFLYS